MELLYSVLLWIRFLSNRSVLIEISLTQVAAEEGELELFGDCGKLY